MKNVLDDKELKEFLKKNRPTPEASSEHERAHILNTIISHAAKNSPFQWKFVQGLAALSLMAFVVFTYWDDSSPLDEVVVMNAIDQTYELDDEADEDDEITDLLALAE